MIAEALRIARKDLRQHRLWVASYLAVVLLAALLVASGVDLMFRTEAALLSIAAAYQAFEILQVALCVTLAVQIVQADRLVGATAFWVTRPISRGALLLSKLLTGIVLLVFLPALLDALVVLACHLAWIDALGAFAENAAIRLALLLPVMTVAAVTADLAFFLVGGIVTVVAAFSFQVVLEMLGFGGWRRSDLGASLAFTALAMVAVGSAASLVHQFFTRRTRRTAVFLLATIAIATLVTNSLQSPFISAPRSLERGWLDPSRVSVSLQREAAGPGEHRQARPAVSYAVDGGPADVVLTVSDIDVAVPGGDRVRGSDRATSGPFDAVVRGTGPRFAGNDKVQHMLGDVRILDAPPAAPAPAIAVNREEVASADADVTLNALAYQACPELRLVDGARGRCGNRQIVVLSADCDSERCQVKLRDVAANFGIDLRRPSRVAYLLVNRRTRQALANGESGYPSRFPVFGRDFAPFTGHTAVTRRVLTFEAPLNMPQLLDAEWLQQSVIVPLQIRDIGEFTVRAKTGTR